MGDVVKRRLLFYQLLMVLGILVIALPGIYYMYQWNEKYNLDENRIRIDYNTLIADIEKLEESNLYNRKTSNDAETPDASTSHIIQSGVGAGYDTIKSNLAFTLIGLDGVVKYTRNMDYAVGQKINLHTLAAGNALANEYRVPVSRNGIQFGTLLVHIDEQYKKNIISRLQYYLPIIVGVIIMCLGIFLSSRFMRRDFFKPLEQIHLATNGITEGRFDIAVTYDYDGEIGTLCHDFDMMRSELRESNLREQEYKRKETLLLASISHDLKTPLATVGNYVEGILYDVVVEREEIKEYAGIILNKVYFINGLIDDILEHSKAGLGEFSINREEVYVKPFFEELLKDLRKEAKQKGFELTYGPVPEILVSIDRQRITQVIRNLVDNSIKYGVVGGQIRIESRIEPVQNKVSQDKLPPNEMLLISIWDNGSGIASADQPFIFDKFYRGDKARNQDIKGSGLGLNIAQYIVHQHGGEIECDSILGVGTTMTFFIEI